MADTEDYSDSTSVPRVTGDSRESADTNASYGESCKTTPTGIATAAKYADIIAMPRPELHHQRMDILNRAKIFAPFDALRGFDEEIDEVDKKTAVDNSVTYIKDDFSE
ncbi:MAG: hypothetical protein DUD27_02745 [Lachnospiraceae bacterium]|nr:MAG: hypothetical protein DUD27_02745 [Lachnospiraceae bacterium]